MRKEKIYFFIVLIITAFLFLACETNDVMGNGSQKTGAAGKNFVGWVDASTKDISNKKGIVHFIVKPNLGTYNICVINEDSKSIPVLSTVDEFTSTSMYLKTGKRIYRLIAGNNVWTGVEKEENGITLTYNIENVAEVNVNLNYLKSSDDSDFDIVKTVVKITNKGSKKETFALKQIIDTVLGETNACHFYTSDEVPVKNEIMYRNPEPKDWIMSKNNSAAMQLFFAGADATVPEVLALANYATLTKATWEPDMLAFRTFDTVLSYNNSAVGVMWPSVKLSPDNSTEVIYYMAFASDNKKPEGEAYILGKTKPEVPEEKILVLPPKEEPKKEEEKPPVEELTYTPKENSLVEFNVNSISREQYSQEYIQMLLDKIADLEKDSSKGSVNRDELLRLNAELDSILSSLRQ